MKLIRSTKCSLKFATTKKRNELSIILNEYSKVVNIFIDNFWLNFDKITKRELLKPIVDIPETWLSARLRKVAAREAIDMINAAKQMEGGRYRWNGISIPDIDKAEKEVKRMYYRGRPTRKYRRLIRLNDRFESGLIMMARHLDK